MLGVRDYLIEGPVLKLSLKDDRGLPGRGAKVGAPSRVAACAKAQTWTETDRLREP